MLAGLPGPGEAAALYTDLMVREDLLQLYGFPTLVEKEWFRLLMTVQGVGAKASLAILGTLGPDGVSLVVGHPPRSMDAPGLLVGHTEEDQIPPRAEPSVRQ